MKNVNEVQCRSLTMKMFTMNIEHSPSPRQSICLLLKIMRSRKCKQKSSETPLPSDIFIKCMYVIRFVLYTHYLPWVEGNVGWGGEVGGEDDGMEVPVQAEDVNLERIES